MKVLLVEDHAVLANITCRNLRELFDHEVEHASTGEAALSLLLRFHPDIVLIDLNLPDMEGYELARRVRANEAFAETTLVALTGWGNLVDPERAAEAGFDAYFRKPMDFEILPRLQRVRR